jgi:hypothetical protein
MAILAAIVGDTNEGKSTAVYNINSPEKLNPNTTIFINANGKPLPFPHMENAYSETKFVPLIAAFLASNEPTLQAYGKYMNDTGFKGNYHKPYLKSDGTIQLMDKDYIQKILHICNELPFIECVVIDELNAVMIDTEMSETFATRKKGGDAQLKWMELAIDIYWIITYANALRGNLRIYCMAHDSYNQETGVRGMLTTGRKTEKIRILSKILISLFTEVTNYYDKPSQYKLLTQTKLVSKVVPVADEKGTKLLSRDFKVDARTPQGMFVNQPLIDNCLGLVDKEIRKFYGIEVAPLIGRINTVLNTVTVKTN